jgi:hypothetical protein
MNFSTGPAQKIESKPEKRLTVESCKKRQTDKCVHTSSLCSSTTQVNLLSMWNTVFASLTIQMNIYAFIQRDKNIITDMHLPKISQILATFQGIAEFKQVVTVTLETKIFQ